MMSNTFLKTDLEGKINNLSHFKTEALFPVFEAIVNSIHAIEERNSSKRGEITVRIIRERSVQASFDENPGDKKEVSVIKNFEIEDNLYFSAISSATILGISRPYPFRLSSALSRKENKRASTPKLVKISIGSV